MVIQLQLRCTKSYFSEEEKEYFTAAALEGKIGQTHYTHPEVEMCYRCPLCDKVINPDGLARHTARHLLMLHNVPNREYVVTLQEDANRKISVKTGNTAARRSGADPPPDVRITHKESFPRAH